MNDNNLSIEDSASKAGSENQKKRKFRWASLQPFAILFGIALLGVILYLVGFKTVVETISKVGWGFLIIIFIHGIRHLLRAFCFYLAAPRGTGKFGIWDALTTRLAGETVGVLTFTGVMASETTKTALLKKKLTIAESLSTIVVDNMTYGVSVIIFILSGAFLMFDVLVGGHLTLKIVLVFIIILMFAGLISFILMCAYKFKPMTSLLKRQGHKKGFPKFISRKKSYITELENDVLHYYENHRTKFYLLLLINLLTHLSSVVEVYLVFQLLGAAPFITTSYVIESLTKVVNFMFSFIPGNLGVSEGGAAVIFLSLGYASATGVALALVRRGAILFWTFIGLLILMARGLTGVVKKDKTETV